MEFSVGNGTSAINKPDRAMRLFISYSRNDETLRKQLGNHLMAFVHQGILAFWHDRLVGAGEEWEASISQHLEQADIILFLVSSDFMASKYCWNIEVKRALERHEEGTARVIPVIVREVKWSLAPFAKLNSLPTDGRAVRRWTDRDRAWSNVVQGIEHAVEELRRERAVR